VVSVEAAMKVVIADDEVHVCSLVKHLIDWEGLRLTLSGVFHSGNDVIAHFEHDPADILICDIEMPGMTGNELIKHISTNYPACKCMVISGFRVFEYARSAMQYGVTKYLLKPIDGDELNAALRSIIHDEKANQSLSNTIGKQSVRLGLIDLLESDIENETLESINSKYHYQFRDGTFTIIKAVFTDIDIHSEFLPRLMTIFTDSIKLKLSDFCIETEVFRTSAISAVVLINYAEGKAGFLPPILDQILRSTLEELGGKTQCKCYFGVGIAAHGIQDLKKSWQTAKNAVYCRVNNENKQTYYAQYTFDPSVNQIVIDTQGKQDFLHYIEAIDIQGIKKWIDNYFSTHVKLFGENPFQAFKFCFLVVDLMIMAFDDLNVTISDKDAFRKNAEIIFDSCSSLSGLKRKLVSVIEEEVSKRLHEKQQNIAVYAQQAKNYIDKHYAETITLEVIAEKLHISPVYLSVVFKSETGMNYSKYLASVRINKAKALLRECSLNLTQITNAVGYDSTTYFSKLFRKHIGLKPLEYRRLHQHDIGE
jgi:two-component system response regulator YesN